MKDFLKRIVSIRMINGHEQSIVTFKYYGDFDYVRDIYAVCKNRLLYIGNSSLDGAPIFQYTVPWAIENIEEANIMARGLKVKEYIDADISEDEKSNITFFRFFISMYEQHLLKGVSGHEIRYVPNETSES